MAFPLEPPPTFFVTPSVLASTVRLNEVLPPRHYPSTPTPPPLPAPPSPELRVPSLELSRTDAAVLAQFEFHSLETYHSGFDWPVLRGKTSASTYPVT
jgi:hypothetical protein